LPLQVLSLTYSQTERATALGWFLSGTLIGPAFGPFLGGIIVAFRSWRDIFWLQTALGGFAAVSVFIYLPETIHRKRYEDLMDLSRKNQAHKMWEWMNPLRVIRLFRYPNLLLAVRI
jgi:MFS family permease